MRTMLIGIGAQKAASTWVFHNLRDHPQVATAHSKQLNIFDTRSRIVVPPFFRRCYRKYRFALRCRGEERRKRLRENTRTLAALFSNRQYLKLFDPDDGLPKDVACEITPIYALLSAASMQRMRDGFAKAGLETRILFIMRDPIERHFSMARMHVTQYGISLEKSARRARQWQHMLLRSKYEHTLTALDTVFHPDEVMLEIHEEITQPESRFGERLCNFLDIEPIPFETLTPVKTTDEREAKVGVSYETPPRLEDYFDPAFCAQMFGETYRECRRRFGPRIDTLWPTTRRMLEAAGAIERTEIPA